MFLRCDPKYRYFWDIKHGEIFSSTNNVSLKTLLSPISKQIIKKGLLNADYLLVGIDASEPRDGQLRNLPVVNEVGSDKLFLKDADMIITKLGATRGYVFDNIMKGENLIGSTELIPYRLTDNSYLPSFLKYLLLLPKYLFAFAYLESGKTPSHWRVNPLDLLRIQIPEIPLKTQSLLMEKIADLQNEINELKDNLNTSVDVIDCIFASEFDYHLDEYIKRTVQNTFLKPFVDFSKTILLRSSVKVQHPRYDYLDEILNHRPWVRLKALCADRIHRGVQPKYDINGEILVVKTLNLKHECLDFSESERVSKEFFETNQTAEIRQNDILVSSTGEGRGKVDIYDLEEPAVADTHISIVRLHNKINPYYVLYFMRSLLGKLQLEMLEIAIKGTPEIYWHQLEKMRIIELPRKKQDFIVERIGCEINKLKNQKARIKELRKKIDTMVVDTIKRHSKK